MNELAPSALTIDGANVPLTGVLADVTIHHGRTEFYDAPSASTMQLTLLDVTRAFTRPFRLGSLVVFTATDGTTVAPRFTGRFTDSQLVEDTFTAIAVGRMRTLSGYTVGTSAYPREYWSQRVERIFADAGLASILVLQTNLNPILVARPAAPVTLSDYLGALTTMVQAAVADRPDGKILVQGIESRSLGAAYVLSPAEVAYAPEWSQRLPGGNVVTVTYGDDGALSVTVRDEASVALYGPIGVSIDTTIESATDATMIGQRRLARDAYAHWNILGAPLLVGRTLAIGQPLQLGSLPPAAPFDPWTPVLEGWTDQIQSDGRVLHWNMQLALSDPLLSGLTLPWNAVPPAEKWNTINQTVAWRDALVLSDVV